MQIDGMALKSKRRCLKQSLNLCRRHATVRNPSESVEASMSGTSATDSSGGTVVTNRIRELDNPDGSVDGIDISDG